MINQASIKVPVKGKGKASVIEGENLSDLFGIDVADGAAYVAAKPARKTKSGKKAKKKRKVPARPKAAAKSSRAKGPVKK